MRYPYELFIRFLITRRADVNATLASFGLPELTDEEIEERNGISSSAMPPSVEEYLDSDKNIVANKEGFLEWAEIHDIREMWEIQPEFKISDERTVTRGSNGMTKACEIFANAQMRTAFSLLVIRAFEYEDIVELFQNRFHYIVTKESYALAVKYFFNFTYMRHNDYVNLLENVSPEERDSLNTALGPTTSNFVEHRIGATPKLTYDEILQDIMVTCYYKFKACHNEPLMDMLAMKWAAMAMKAGEQKEKYGKGDKMGLQQQLELKFEFDEPTFPSLEELKAPSDSSD